MARITASDIDKKMDRHVKQCTNEGCACSSFAREHRPALLGKLYPLVSKTWDFDDTGDPDALANILQTASGES